MKRYSEAIEDFERTVKSYIRNIHRSFQTQVPIRFLVVWFISPDYKEIYQKKFQHKVYFMPVMPNDTDHHLTTVMIARRINEDYHPRDPKEIQQLIDFRRWLVTHGYTV